MLPRLVTLVVAGGLLLPSPAAGPEPEGRAAQVRVRSFRLLNEGVAAYNRGEYDTAVDRLRQVASMALNSFRAYYYLGLALIGDRRYREALEALDVALELDPQHLQSLVALGDAHLKLGDVAEARAGYFRALKLRPEFPAALDGLARSYESQANEAEAIRHYQRAIASDRGYAPAYTHLGDLYLERDRLEEAVRLLEEAIAVRPDFAPGLNRLALAYGRLGLHNEAVATIRQAQELEPADPSHPATLGKLQLSQGFISAAEASFRATLALDQGFPEAREGLAEVARRRGDYGAALVELGLALADERLEARTRDRLEGYRDVLVAERDRLAELEQRVGGGEAASVEYAELAGIYSRRGLWERAAELQRLAGEDPPQRERLAFMLFHAGRYRDAHVIYSRLADTRRQPRDLVNDGVTLAFLGDDDAAAEAFRSALSLEPGQLRARLYLGNALLRQGQNEEAAKVYREYLDRRRDGEAPERVRRILRRIAPDLLPPPPADPVPAPPAAPASAEPAPAGAGPAPDLAIGAAS